MPNPVTSGGVTGCNECASLQVRNRRFTTSAPQGLGCSSGRLPEAPSSGVQTLVTEEKLRSRKAESVVRWLRELGMSESCVRHSRRIS